jgi:hypothetical protein
MNLLSNEWLYQEQVMDDAAIPMQVTMLTMHVRWLTDRLEALERMHNDNGSS